MNKKGEMKDMIRSNEKVIELITEGKELEYLFFWGHTGNTPQGVFSQWYPSEFTVDDKTYITAEHWMMAEKARLFNDESSVIKILKTNHPLEAKKKGRAVKNFDIKTWTENCFEIVVQGNCHKFIQNPEMLEYLLSTGDKVLVEASPYDKIWGIGMKVPHKDINNPRKWQGENLLGYALMEVRERLKKEK